MDPLWLLPLTVTLLLLLILGLRVHALLALLLSSMFVALAGGIAPDQVMGQLQDAMGRTLGYISLVIGLGAIFGELLFVSGGAGAIANRLTQLAGTALAPWALAGAGLLVAIPVFFDVALVLLMPFLYAMCRNTGTPLLKLALPLLCGLAVAHAFIPPTPGPVAVAGIVGAELGWVIVFGLAAGVPALAVGGIWFGGIASRITVAGVPALQADPASRENHMAPRPASMASALALITLPLALILASTITAAVLPEASALRVSLGLLGHPVVALLLTTVLSIFFLGTRCGLSLQAIQDSASRALLPVGMVILVTGAGGVLGKMLLAAGVGDSLAPKLAELDTSLPLIGFLIAATLRVAQGSATVAMVTAAGFVAPLLSAGDSPAPLLAAVTVAIAAGATVLSHVNDSGFWLVSRYLGLSEKQTLQTWTVATTLLGVTGLLSVLLLSSFL
ncbi:MAG: gluconate:H+ symporter [Lysobacterales bacterium]